MNDKYKNLSKEELLRLVKEQEEELKTKKYGLVWDSEREPEEVVLKCKENLPVLEKVKEKEIKTDNGEDNIVKLEYEEQIDEAIKQTRKALSKVKEKAEKEIKNEENSELRKVKNGKEKQVIYSEKVGIIDCIEEALTFISSDQIKDEDAYKKDLLLQDAIREITSTLLYNPCGARKEGIKVLEN